MASVGFRTQMLRVREDAIVDAVIRLLAEKGYDLMTVDEVAAEVGISKASLYRHFDSKEALAAAAMVRLLERTMAVVIALEAEPGLSAWHRMQRLTRWAVATQLSGEMPTLPSQNGTLRTALAQHPGYLSRLVEVTDHLGAWIEEARACGDLDTTLPSDVVLFTLFARACDPVAAVLRSTGRYADEAIIDLCVQTCFLGLAGRQA